MTNKTRAIVDESRALQAKNRELLAQIEKLEEDDLVNSIKYENLIAQLLKVAGGSMTLPNPDLFAIRGEVRSTINADGSLTLTYRRWGDDDGT